MSFPQALFSTPTAFVRRGLDALARTVDLVMPLNGAHRRDLPDACRDLSALLTSRRDGLSRPYWTSPRLTSAYLRYFLPWNLVRLTALLPGLPLDAPHPADAGEFLILDLGSGPCTFPLALWLARPDLRRRPVTVVASDSAPHILDLGRRIFDALRAELDPASPWSLRTWRVPLHAAPRQLRGRPGLITLGNVLNELEQRERRSAALRDTLAALLDDMAGLLAPGGHVLAVEPGTRQGGRLTATLRDMALGYGVEPDEDDGDEDGDGDLPAFAARQPWDGEDQSPRFRALAPCPHHEPCPLLNGSSKAWCHAHAPAEDWGDAAPAALAALSRAAGLSKDSVSLAFLLLERLDNSAPCRAAAAPGVRVSGLTGKVPRLRARVLSDAFVLPGAPGRARYACTERGLALIPDAAFLPPGALCELCPTPGRDAKSGARIMNLPGSETSAPDPKTHGPRCQTRTQGSPPLGARRPKYRARNQRRRAEACGQNDTDHTHPCRPRRH